MQHLKSSLRDVRDHARRIFRMARYGDAEKVSSFDRGSPELVRTIWPMEIVSRLKVLAEHLLQALRRTHAELLSEDRTLVPDPPSEFTGLSYGKYYVGQAFKNGFSLFHSPTGETIVPAEARGLHFFIGRHLSERREGVLEISLHQASEKKILRKKLSALEAGWNSFFVDLSGNGFGAGERKLRWDLKPAGRRAFFSGPLIKTKGKERTVLVLIADALRPGAIGPKTPEIDRFFGKGLRFENSFSQSNWTLPSFASMATSLYASQHHVVDPDVYSRVLDRNCPTLAELFRKKGFFTYGSVSHRRCNHSIGHHRGFEHFRYAQTVESRHKSPGARGVNDMARQLDELTAYLKNLKGFPFFGFVHFFDTHFPFFLDPLGQNRRHLLHEDSTQRTVLKSFRGNLPADEVRYLEDCFLEKVSELDGRLGELFRLLEQRENVTVILTSDHGYSFANPLGNDLSEEEIRTPFLIRSNEFPVPAGRTGRPVESSVDLLPTLTSLYGIEDAAPRSGSPALRPDGTVPPKDLAVSELVYLENYRLRVMGFSGGPEGSHILLGTKRRRSRPEIDVENLKIIEHHGAQNLRGGIAGLKIDAALKTGAERLLDALTDHEDRGRKKEAISCR